MGQGGSAKLNRFSAHITSTVVDELLVERKIIYYKSMLMLIPLQDSTQLD